MDDKRNMIGPRFIQFKNAVHYGQYKHQSYSQQSANKESYQRSQLNKQQQKPNRISQRQTILAFSEQLLTKNPNKISIQGLGATVDDQGHLLMAQWKNNKINGRYFLFKPNIVDSIQDVTISLGICQYGCMKQGILQGQNYIYNMSGTILKGVFSGNICGEEVFILRQGLLQSKTSNQQLECQVIQTRPSNKQQIRHNGSIMNKKQMLQSSRQLKKSRQNQSPVIRKTPKKDFTFPLQFLQQMGHPNNKQKKKDEARFIRSDLDQHQSFVGFSTYQKDDQDDSQKLFKIATGFGVIFRDSWPYKYGSMTSSRLNGIGVYYQNQILRNQGLFLNDCLVKGLHIDIFKKTALYGQLQHDQNDKKQPLEFIVSQSINILTDYRVLLAYKKNLHLQSLNYINSYFLMPQLIAQSPWPYNVIEKLNKHTIGQTIIRVFRPSYGNSEAKESLNYQQYRQNRSYLSIAQMDSSQVAKVDAQIQKKLIQKNGLQSRRDSPFRLKDYLAAYKQIQKNLSKSKNKSRSKSRSKQSIKMSPRKLITQAQASPRKTKQKASLSGSPYYFSPSPVRAQVSTIQQQSLANLIVQYKNCKTESHSGLKTVFNQKESKNSSGLKSKRQMMRLDHSRYWQQRKSATKYYAPMRSDLDLHSIYKKFLRK